MKQRVKNNTKTENSISPEEWLSYFPKPPGKEARYSCNLLKEPQELENPPAFTKVDFRI